MQFLVERFCPNSGTDADCVIEEPFVVWIDFNDRVPASCGHPTFGTTPAGEAAFARAGFEVKDPLTHKAAVCEHMGRIIE